jgi:hypothetical protein
VDHVLRADLLDGPHLTSVMLAGPKNRWAAPSRQPEKHHSWLRERLPTCRAISSAFCEANAIARFSASRCAGGNPAPGRDRRSERPAYPRDGGRLANGGLLPRKPWKNHGFGEDWP